jgi:hypothetical protein
MVYGLLSEFIGIFESILVSLSILSALTLLDIYGIKKIKRKYSTLVHTISYFGISLILVLFLHNLVSDYPFLLSLEILIFITMQFYTNYSLFTSIKEFNPDKKDSLKEIQVKIRHLLGIGFYATLSFFIFQALYLQRIELQLILLILSIVIHVLMIIDRALLKFLGKVSDYIRVISWLFIMTFTSTYLVWVFGTYFITFIFTVIPIIITILILELAYLFKLLGFWRIISSNKVKIRFYLIVATYLNFITWPLYFARLNPIILLNLVLASFFIMISITFIDDKLNVLKEKFRKSLRSYSFLIIGGLLSIDVFFLLDLIPDFNLFLNLSISSLVFVLFLGIKIKPFKEHSAIAALFWLVIFLLLSVIVYFVSLSWIAGLLFLIITCMVYPFVFLLEELKELFSKLVDIISKFFRSLKIIIKKMFIKIFSFLKTYFKYVWIPFSMLISVFIGLLFSPLIFNVLTNWIHSILVMISIFGLMCLVIPYRETADPDRIFRRRILRLSIGWGSVIGLLFVVITPDWYIFTFFISIAVIGTIIVVYLLRKEEREKISVKWRFYTLLTLTILFILFGILLGWQVYVYFF